MALTDLTNTVWYFNDTIIISSDNTWLINFWYYNNYSSSLSTTVLNSIMSYNTSVYINGVWSISKPLRCIKIVGGDVTDINLIAFLQQNATQVIVEDLTNTKWKIKENADFESFPFASSISIDGSSHAATLFNGVVSPELQSGDIIGGVVYSSGNKVLIPIGGTLYAGNNLDVLANHTLEITDGNDITNFSVIGWFTINAIWINEPHDVTVLYNDIPIASLDDTGKKTLLTAGKYCQDNIVIDYTKTGKQIYMDWALNLSGFYFDASNSEHTEVLGELSTIGEGAFMQRAFSGNFTFSSMTTVPSRAFAFATFNQTTSSFTAAFPVATSIYNYAFQNNYGITGISAPSCTSIGSQAFQSCYNLVSANFPSCTSVGSYAFGACSKLSDIYFPNITSVGTYAFSGCSSLTTISFSKLTSTSTATFDRCSYITSVSLPSLTTIGGYTFRSCYRLPSISLSKCTAIGSHAFYYCSALSQVNIPSATNVGSSAFYYCSSLTEVSFPNCSSVYSNAFLNCSNLTQAYIGKGKTFGTYCFSGCNKLESLIIASTAVATFGTGMLTNTAISKSTYLGRWGSIFVPSTLVSSYKTATGWTAFSARITSIVE